MDVRRYVCASQTCASRSSVVTICRPSGENAADHICPEVLARRDFLEYVRSPQEARRPARTSPVMFDISDTIILLNVRRN